MTPGIDNIGVLYSVRTDTRYISVIIQAIYSHNMVHTISYAY